MTFAIKIIYIKSTNGFKPHAIIHLAAIHYIPYCNAHQTETLDVNVTGTQNILSALENLNSCKYFVMASSAAVYKDKNELCHEGDEVEAVDIYGQSKILCEDLLHKSQLNHMAIRILRFFNVFGEHDPVPHLIPEIIKQFSNGGEIVLGSTNNYRDFIHAHDVAKAIYASLDNTLEKLCVFNVGTSKPSSANDIIHLILSIIKKINPDFSITLKEGDAERTRAHDRQFLCANIGKISSQLCWQPSIALEDGLTKLISHANLLV